MSFNISWVSIPFPVLFHPQAMNDNGMSASRPRSLYSLSISYVTQFTGYVFCCSPSFLVSASILKLLSIRP